MGRCIISIGSGGGAIDTDELTAKPENVEVGKSAAVLGYDDPVSGTLRNVSNDSNILYNSNSSMHVVQGSNAYVSANSDGISRAQIRFRGTRGVIEDNTIIGVPQNDMASAGGLNAGKLLAGQSAFGINGTATSDANFGDGDLLIGKTAYKNGSKRTGTMPNRGAVASSLNCGGSYTIPAGYHNGSGKITANSLASQTSANATRTDMLNGKTAWVNGSKITGTIPSLSGATYTPATSAQTISCSGKYMTSNIIINPIPSNYADMTTGITVFDNGQFPNPKICSGFWPYEVHTSYGEGISNSSDPLNWSNYNYSFHHYGQSAALKEAINFTGINSITFRVYLNHVYFENDYGSKSYIESGSIGIGLCDVSTRKEIYGNSTGKNEDGDGKWRTGDYVSVTLNTSKVNGYYFVILDASISSLSYESINSKFVSIKLA